ncbi:hypothetical protein ACFLZ2_00520 [Candidatus Margulisiibacteriota bacterium]
MAVSSLSGLLIGAYIFYYINRIIQRFRLSRRAGGALIAQEEAEDLLKKHNFKIVDKQRRADIITFVDGKPNLSFVQADYIVEKRGKYYVAEVKAGESVASPRDPATRRQLLEYKFAYQPDGLILVDMIERRLHLIDFYLPEKGEDKFIKIIIAVMVVGVLLGLLWLFVSIKIL